MRYIAACLALMTLCAVSASATSVTTGRLGQVRAAPDFTYFTINQPKVVISASSTVDSSFYVEDAERCAGIKVLPVSGLFRVVPGDRVSLAGPVITDTEGKKCLRAFTVTKAAGSEISALGVSNSRLYNGSPTLNGMYVTTWGKVHFIAGDGAYFYINDGTTQQGVRVVIHSYVSSIAQTNIRGQYVSVRGIMDYVGDVGTPDEKTIPVIYVRNAGDITVLSDAPVVPYPLGLTVDGSGTLMHNGEPYKGIGVDYCDAFTRTLDNPEDTSYREGFAALAQRHIPFVRIWAMGYWPIENALYWSDKSQYYELMDDVVRSAEDNHVGLIFSMFFNYSCVPDMVYESCNQWGNPNSQVQAFMRQYIAEMSARYKDSPALWGWEFGNELNLAGNLPNAADWLPPTWTDLGCPPTRSVADELNFDQIRTAFAQFASAVRVNDPSRFIDTGSGEPRSCAWHNMHDGTWTQDTQDEFHQMWVDDNPDPVDSMSLHTYDTVEQRFNTNVSVADFFAMCKGYADSQKKPIYVGEFGSPNNGDPVATSTTFYTILNAIQTSGIPLASLWVYDFSSQDTVWNVTANNDRSWQLDAIQAANAAMQP